MKEVFSSSLLHFVDSVDIFGDGNMDSKGQMPFVFKECKRLWITASSEDTILRKTDDYLDSWSGIENIIGVINFESDKYIESKEKDDVMGCLKNVIDEIYYDILLSDWKGKAQPGQIRRVKKGRV
jgi:hypothetical protein